MPKWKKDSTQFTVSVNPTEKGVRVYLPRPLYEHLGEPSDITFVIEGKRVLIRAQ